MLSWLREISCNVSSVEPPTANYRLTYMRSAAAIDELLRQPRDSPYTRIVFFFCEPDFTDSLNAVVILGCLLRQLIDIEKLDSGIEDQLRQVFEGSPPDVSDLEPVLQLTINKSSAVTFIIDGLDGCTTTDRAIILEILSRVVDSSERTVKVLVSARESLIDDICRSFETYRHITTSCSGAQFDIPLYLEKVLKERVELGDLVVADPQLVQEIERTLAHRANGM